MLQSQKGKTLARAPTHAKQPCCRTSCVGQPGSLGRARCTASIFGVGLILLPGKNRRLHDFPWLLCIKLLKHNPPIPSLSLDPPSPLSSPLPTFSPGRNANDSTLYSAPVHVHVNPSVYENLTNPHREHHHLHHKNRTSLQTAPEPEPATAPASPDADRGTSGS